MLKFSVKGHGELEIEGLTPAGLPSLKIVKGNSPNMTVNCHNGIGYLRVCLKDIDLTHPIKDAPEQFGNIDRAQLSKLGGS